MFWLAEYDPGSGIKSELAKVSPELRDHRTDDQILA
jgi:hypothetical protein